MNKDSDDIYLDAYTLYPPEEEISLDELPKLPAHVPETKIKGETNILLKMRWSEYKRTKNPICVVEAFLIAHEAGIYPPMWALDFLHTGFKEYHDSQGLKDLSKLFGLKRGKGQDPIFQPLIEEDRDSMLCLDVYRLQTSFDFSVEEASYMVARRLEETENWNKSLFKIWQIGEETIKDKYLKKWKNIFDKDFIRDEILSWTKEEKAGYLKQFPEDSYPVQ